MPNPAKARHQIQFCKTKPPAILALSDHPDGGARLAHHSERGCQYACGDYRGLLRRHGIACSMSRPGDCYDNAAMESFWSTLNYLCN